MTKVSLEMIGDKAYLRELDDDNRTVRLHGPIVSSSEVYELGQPIVQEVEEKDVVRKRFKKIKRASGKQERKIAADIGGRVQPASGATPFAKGDVRKAGVARVEAKFTYGKSWTLSKETFLKIMSESTLTEVPSIVVDFKDRSSDKTDLSLVVIHYQDWVKAFHGKDADD